MKVRECPTQKELKERFDYVDGNLVYKYSPVFSVIQGTVAGSNTAQGYISVKMNRINYLAHRLIYVWHHGYIAPGLEIDHINRIRSDNRIENLRVATREMNMRNTNPRGYFRNGGKWRAQIKVDGRRINLGAFETETEAHNAYLEAKKIYHKPECCNE